MYIRYSCSVFLSLLFLFCSCHDRKDAQQRVMVSQTKCFDLCLDRFQVQECKYSDLFSKVDYVFLEDKEEALFGDFCRMTRTNDKDFVFLDLVNRKVVRFDSLGNFLNTIGERGRAENEYIDPKLICYNKYKDEILINDHSGRCILVYRPDGTYLYKIPLNCIINAMSMVNDSLIACYLYYWIVGENGYERKKDFVVFDTAGQIVYQDIPHNNKITFDTDNNNVFEETPRGLLFCHPCTHVVYRVTESCLVPEYCFSFSSNNLAERWNVGDSVSVSIYPEEIHPRRLWHFIEFGESRIYALLFYDEKSFLYSMDSIANQSVHVYPWTLNIRNDMYGKVGFQLGQLTFGGKMYQLISSDVCQEILDSKILLSDKERSLLERGARNKNYILQVCTFK